MHFCFVNGKHNHSIISRYLTYAFILRFSLQNISLTERHFPTIIQFISTEFSDRHTLPQCSITMFMVSLYCFLAGSPTWPVLVNLQASSLKSVATNLVASNSAGLALTKASTAVFAAPSSFFVRERTQAPAVEEKRKTFHLNCLDLCSSFESWLK